MKEGGSGAIVAGALFLVWIAYWAGRREARARQTFADFRDTQGKLRVLRKLRWVHFWAAIWVSIAMWIGIGMLIGKLGEG